MGPPSRRTDPIGAKYSTVKPTLLVGVVIPYVIVVHTAATARSKIYSSKQALRHGTRGRHGMQESEYRQHQQQLLALATSSTGLHSSLPVPGLRAGAGNSNGWL
ncbi:hypothetical protein ElyMa_002686000 [Elysia marginata]|uniref:Uncharacterized protein n=1 Tax=Elysia marginata TaxID=1093978 RepID=A0AAV4HDP7_9GAST|nr:hypothetical protein ElyMa_002686000 [Elysia marginata]